MKALTFTVFIWLLAQALALAQVHTAATPVPIATSTPIPLLSGVLLAITSGDSATGNTVNLKISPTVQLTFRLASALVIVGSAGGAVDSSMLTPGTSITAHFMQDGNELVIDRIFLR